MCLVHFVKKQTTYKIMDIYNKSKIYRNESMAKGRGVVEQICNDDKLYISFATQLKLITR